MNAILDIGAPTVDRGIVTRRLKIAGHEGRTVPAVLFTPEGASEPGPVVLVGHGARSDKETEPFPAIGRIFVRRGGWASIIIDGPIHGERRPAGLGDPMDHFVEERMLLGRRETYEAMVADWRGVIDALGEVKDVGNGQVGYIGFSMGTLLGVPTVAAEPRIRCAVFCIGGMVRRGSAEIQVRGFGGHPGHLPVEEVEAANAARNSYLLQVAAGIGQRQVLMLNQSEDELFPREGAFQLYDALTGPKRLMFFPGKHVQMPRESMDQAVLFFREHLAGDEAPKNAQ
jgi:dienelactone hydrolase